MNANKRAKIFTKIVNSIKKLAIDELGNDEWYGFSLQFKIDVDGNLLMIGNATLENFPDTKNLNKELKLCKDYYNKTYKKEKGLLCQKLDITQNIMTPKMAKKR